MSVENVTTYSASTDNPIEAANEILAKFGDDKFAFFVVFFSHQYIGDGLRDALALFSDTAPTIGCSTAGEITEDGYQSGHMLVIGFPASGYYAEFTKIDFKQNDALQTLPKTILEMKQSVQSHGEAWKNEFALLLSDGLARNEDLVVAAIGPALGGIPLFGGSAGDGMEFKETALYADGELLHQHSLCAIIKTRFAVKAFRFDHFEPSNTQMIVTHADPEERIVYEINAEPAALEYARLINQPVSNLSAITFATNPVMVSVGGQHHVRAIQKVEPDHALRFFCAIDEGLVLTLANPRDILEDTRAKLESLNDPAIILAFDCIFRRLEVEKLQATRQMSNILSEKNVVGFGTYGEQFDMLHVNQTLTGIAIYNSEEH